MTTTKAQQSRSREIKLIHVARRELQIDEGTYRAMLEQVAGVKSSADLDATGRKKVLDHLKSKGFKVKSNGAAVSPSRNANDPQYRKIQALWSELERLGAVRVNSEAAIRVYTKRVTRCNDFSFCSSAQVTVIIESLKKWRDRVMGASPADAATVSESAHA